MFVIFLSCSVVLGGEAASAYAGALMQLRSLEHWALKTLSAYFWLVLHMCVILSVVLVG